MANVKVRFAPSPTGPLHIGGARSALFNYLYAENQGGVLLVRMEDTDLERSKPEYEKEILLSLTWLGMHWHEGIEVGGEHGPYRQTERLETYNRYVAKLMESGHAYYCFCSEEELEAERQQLTERGETPRYLGKCRSLSPEEVARRINAGMKPTIRFRVPEGQTIEIEDRVRGHVAFETDTMGDYIIVKSDGIPTYNFAVVIDDLEMKVTHVIRAEEHLSNTPRQVLIYDALNAPQPEFAHISLILGADRQKMSKRHGATSVMEYREKGYLPEALFNFLSLMGWSPEGEQEIMTQEEIIRQFGLNRVAKNPAVFDLDKLNWMNAQYIKMKTPQELGALIRPYLEKSVYAAEVGQLSADQYEALTEGLRDYLVCLSDAASAAEAFFDLPVYDDEAKAVLDLDETKTMLAAFLSILPADLTLEEARAFMKEAPKKMELGAKKVYMPLRIALTGKTKGPELPFLLAVLGKDAVAARLSPLL